MNITNIRNRAEAYKAKNPGGLGGAPGFGIWWAIWFGSDIPRYVLGYFLVKNSPDFPAGLHWKKFA